MMRYWDWTDWFTHILLVILISVVIIGCIAIYQQNKECVDRGGEMIGTGEYSTTWTTTGDTMIPITTEEMECSK